MKNCNTQQAARVDTNVVVSDERYVANDAARITW